MHIYNVILPIKLNQIFSYLSQENLEIGDIVLVPFGRMKKTAIIWQIVNSTNIKKLKEIKKTISKRKYNKNYLKFIKRFADYNLISLGQVADLILPNQKILDYFLEKNYYYIKNKNLTLTKQRKLLLDYLNIEKEEENIINDLKTSKTYLQAQIKAGFLQKTAKETFSDVSKEYILNQDISLSAEQEKVFFQIKENLKSFSVSLINGVTGSGKTEIYFRLIAEVLEKQTEDSQILILVPEILLTKQLLDKFQKRFAQKPFLWHSATPIANKKKIWYNLKNEKIIIGTRSSLFLPFHNLKLIILDEEHDNSYKQEDIVSYNARDMAVLKGYIENIPIILGTATPSLETILNIKQGKYKEYFLKNRYGQAELPEINIIDLKKEFALVQDKNKQIITERLKDEIRKTLFKKEQVLLFLNRKGYAPLNICLGCGYKYQCNNCQIFLVAYKSRNILTCHHCDYTISTEKNCPSCKEETKILNIGFGVEKLQETIKKNFVNSNIAVLTAEKSKEELKQSFQDIEDNKIDIIIGTQILSKGHHFKNLTLVGVIDADISDSTDIRANEKMFQLIQQISGRAGREQKKGRIFLQSLNPDVAFLQAIKNYDIDNFYQLEINSRKKFNLPPYSKFVAIIVSHKQKNIAEETANDLANYFKNWQEVKVLGVIKAPLFFLRNHYRFRILLKLEKKHNIKTVFDPIFDEILKNKAKIKIDVDPMNFL